MTVSTTKTPDNLTEYSNSAIELHILVNHHPSKIFPPTTNSSNTKNLPQLGVISVISCFCPLDNWAIKSCSFQVLIETYPRKIQLKKVSEILDLLFHFELSYNTFLETYSARIQMQINNFYILNLDTYMSNLGFSDNFIHRYVKLISTYYPNKKQAFYLEKIATFLRLERSQASNFLKKCQNSKLLTRHRDTLNTGERKVGNIIHLELTPPNFLAEAYDPAETEDNMTFFAKFDKIIETIHERYTTKEVQFSEVYNVNQTIHIKHAWQTLQLDCLNSKALESLKAEEGDYLCFKARVIKDNKGKNFLTDIHTILPMEAFYNNQYGAM